MCTEQAVRLEQSGRTTETTNVVLGGFESHNTKYEMPIYSKQQISVFHVTYF